MEDNPFSKLVELMRSSASEVLPAGFRIGRVMNGNSLSIDVGGAVQGISDLVFLGSPLPSFESGAQLLLWPIENEQRYIVFGRLFGL